MEEMVVLVVVVGWGRGSAWRKWRRRQWRLWGGWWWWWW